MSKAPVVLWCHPRSVSTAFERAFLQRSEEFHCLHEPFGDVYYFGPQRQSMRYKNSIQLRNDKLNSATFEYVCDEILMERDGKRTFVKDMACHVTPYVKEKRLPIDGLICTFLIRDPQVAVPSMYKCSVSASTGWGHFDPIEMGYVEQKELFDYVRSLHRETPIVVNSHDLVTNPKAILQQYCESVHVEYNDSMISWEPKLIKHFDKWTGWHEYVKQLNPQYRK